MRTSTCKILLTILCAIIALTMIVSLSACGPDDPRLRPLKDRAREEVEGYCTAMCTGMTIGGNGIKFATPVVTTMESCWDTEIDPDVVYKAYGTVTVTDVYSQKWQNTFTCYVLQDDAAELSIKSFEFASSTWKKV